MKFLLLEDERIKSYMGPTIDGQDGLMMRVNSSSLRDPWSAQLYDTADKVSATLSRGPVDVLTIHDRKNESSINLLADTSYQPPAALIYGGTRYPKQTGFNGSKFRNFWGGMGDELLTLDSHIENLGDPASQTIVRDVCLSLAPDEKVNAKTELLSNEIIYMEMTASRGDATTRMTHVTNADTTSTGFSTMNRFIHTSSLNEDPTVIKLDERDKRLRSVEMSSGKLLFATRGTYIWPATGKLWELAGFDRESKATSDFEPEFVVSQFDSHRSTINPLITSFRGPFVEELSGALAKIRKIIPDVSSDEFGNLTYSAFNRSFGWRWGAADALNVIGHGSMIQPVLYDDTKVQLGKPRKLMSESVHIVVNPDTQVSHKRISTFGAPITVRHSDERGRMDTVALITQDYDGLKLSGFLGKADEQIQFAADFAGGDSNFRIPSRKINLEVLHE